MKLSAAPLFRSDVGDSFGEIPAVAMKILGVVLALAVGLVGGLAQNGDPVLACALAVTFRILDADLNVLRVIWRDLAFGDGEAPIPGFHLDAVVRDTQADSKPEGL